jgi:hypothetical protein
MDILKQIWDGWSPKYTLTETEIGIINKMDKEQLAWFKDVLLDDIMEPKDAIALILGYTQSRRTDSRLAKAQSAREETVVEEDTSQEQEENIMFADAEKQIDLQVGLMNQDVTYNQGYQENGSLANFMSRPVEIYRKTWEVGAVSAFADEINPWELFLDDARVKNKLDTFKLLRATLKLKFQINGSPYHYGRVFIGVRPTRYDNNMSIAGINSVLTTTNYETNAVPISERFGKVFYSQRPHIFIDPSTNQPMHIDWPFFAATNYLDLNAPQSIDRMGRLEIWELNTLQHNNGATDPLTITGFAWLEDVQLTGLTSNAVAVAQSTKTSTPVSNGKKKSGKKIKKQMPESNNTDEYQKDGMISGPASAIADYANYFTEIPVIGDFARATHIASGAVADVARLFGFSRPPIITDPMIMRPQLSANMATFSGGDCLNKLSLDPKQELTIDPGSVGLPSDDQMAFGFLAKKEAFIGTFVWDSQIPTERRIFSVAVHPMVRPINQLSSGNYLYTQTPLSHICTPFESWRGSLRFRFQIVASAFHRGRLAVVYDPSDNPAADFDLNNRYACILDLAEAKDFTIEVKWSQMQPYCNVRVPFDKFVMSKGYPGILTGIPAFNGILQVYVMNELASSITTSAVDVNVYISAGDDFQVQKPNDEYKLLSYARQDQTVGPPAFAQSEVITTQENDPNQDTMCLINGSYCTHDPRSNLVFFGEQIVSIRSLMKRYNFHRPLTNQGLDADETYSLQYNIFNLPVGPGPTYGSSITSGTDTISGSFTYNVVALTHIRYFMQSYIGWRGAVRYKAIFSKGQGDTGLIKATRSSDRILSEQSNAVVIKETGSSRVQINRAYLSQNGESNVLEGFCVNSALVNPSLEYELPMYHPMRYVEVNEPVIATGTDDEKYQGNYNGGGHFLNMNVRNTDAKSFPLLEVYTAIGEDFSFFFFIGASPIYTSDVFDAT